MNQFFSFPKSAGGYFDIGNCVSQVRRGEWLEGAKTGEIEFLSVGTPFAKGAAKVSWVRKE
jgi:hypothetical protein